MSSTPVLSLGDPADVKSFNVYSYEHLDDLSFLRKPEDVFRDDPTGSLPFYIELIQARLLEAGWEGDGRLGVIWFPPFVDIGIEDTWGTYAWCVKQSNNGITWIASGVPLRFKRLADQDEWLPYETHKRAGLMTVACARFLAMLAAVKEGLTRRIDVLPRNANPVFEEIRNEMLLNSQGEIVAQFNLFLDDCYLHVLDEVIEYGNTSKLHLSKFKATIEPKQYLPDAGFVSDEEIEGNKWLTMQGLIRDIWISYQFEPFQQKAAMLFKACEFQTDSPEMKTIRTHVQLRNCVQHHARRITREALQSLGVKRIEILQDEGHAVCLSPGDLIVFSLAEWVRLADAMSTLTIAFSEHTAKRIRRKVWLTHDAFTGSR